MLLRKSIVILITIIRSSCANLPEGFRKDYTICNHVTDHKNKAIFYTLIKSKETEVPRLSYEHPNKLSYGGFSLIISSYGYENTHDFYNSLKDELADLFISESNNKDCIIYYNLSCDEQKALNVLDPPLDKEVFFTTLQDRLNFFSCPKFHNSNYNDFDFKDEISKYFNDLCRQVKINVLKNDEAIGRVLSFDNYKLGKHLLDLLKEKFDFSYFETIDQRNITSKSQLYDSLYLILYTAFAHCYSPKFHEFDVNGILEEINLAFENNFHKHSSSTKEISFRESSKGTVCSTDKTDLPCDLKCNDCHLKFIAIPFKDNLKHFRISPLQSPPSKNN